LNRLPIVSAEELESEKLHHFQFVVADSFVANLRIERPAKEARIMFPFPVFSVFKPIWEAALAQRSSGGMGK
jgi:hypothetical protein